MLHIKLYYFYQNLVSILIKKNNLSLGAIIISSLLMDLQWLLPEQIEQILKFCELSSVQDMSVAANILQHNDWNLEEAMHDVIKQNDKLEQKEKQQTRNAHTSAHQYQQQIQQEWYDPHEGQNIEDGWYPQGNSSHQLPGHIEGEYEANKQDDSHFHKLIKFQQNLEYEAMQKDYFNEKQLVNAKKIAEQQKQLEISQLKQKFEQEEQIEAQNKICIKFRLSSNGATPVRQFSIHDPIQKLFDYVSGTQRGSFQEKYADFDLTQVFPNLSLKQQKGKRIGSVFEGSNMQMLIVKEV